MSIARRLKFSTLAFALQTFFVLMFAFTAKYDDPASPKAAPTGVAVPGYAAFQDVQAMIFVGFGFLMTFLRRYGYTSLAINFFLATVVIQWSMIVRGCIYDDVLKGEKFAISLGGKEFNPFISIAGCLKSYCQLWGNREPGLLQASLGSLFSHYLYYRPRMFSANFAAATVLISFGAILGKTSPLQLLIMAIIETVLAQVNGYVCHEIFHAVDIGESMYIHAFGAYFGLSVSFVLQNKNANGHHKSESCYHSDIFSFIGTIFLWMFWPSFNGGAATGDEQHRAFINTFLSLCACTVVSFLLSALYDKKGKLTAEHIQNATLAGGVAVGTTADMPLEPFGAMCMGAAAGFISVTGYRFISGKMAKYLRVHDTCGVHNLHGMPAVLAAVAGAIMATRSSADKWGRSYYEIFPYVAPKANTTEYADLIQQSAFADIEPGKGWSSGKQGSNQIIALAITLGIAIVGGIVTGVILKIPILDQVYSEEDLFEDSIFWNQPEEEEEEGHKYNVDTRNGTELKSYPDWKAERGTSSDSGEPNSNIRL